MKKVLVLVAIAAASLCVSSFSTPQAKAAQTTSEQDVLVANRTWICTICGYKAEGAEPPKRCPRCENEWWEEKSN